jgi:hypothetical protein
MHYHGLLSFYQDKYIYRKSQVLLPDDALLGSYRIAGRRFNEILIKKMAVFIRGKSP